MYFCNLKRLCLLIVFFTNVVSVPYAGRKLSEHPVILVVSFDGFRYDYLNKVNTPTLHSIKASGVSVPYMIPVFPTKTFPNHQAIATGLYTESHGIVDNSFFDPKYNKTLSGFTDDPGFWNYHPEVLPIWIRNEMAGSGRTSGCAMWPGSSQPYGPNNDSLPTYYYPKYNGSIPWEERVDTVISWMTNETNPANLVFLYYDEPDTHGHAFGPNQDETLEEISKADNRAAYLVDKLTEAQIFDKINLIILSDHGMQNVTQQRIVNITELIDPSLLEAKYGGSPLLQLIPKEGKGDELYRALNQSMSRGYTIWAKEELRYRWRYTESRRILDYILVADPGYAFDDFSATIKYYNEKWNFTESETREYGVHGYSNEAASMRPIFLARGPAFREGYTFQPIKNIDIVPLLSKILGIAEAPNNGSLSRVVEMIKSEFATTSTSTTTTNKPGSSAVQKLEVSKLLLITSIIAILHLLKFTSHL